MDDNLPELIDTTELAARIADLTRRSELVGLDQDAITVRRRRDGTAG
jgi:hypothetical protein